MRMMMHFRYKSKQESMHREIIMSMARAGAKLAETARALMSNVEESQGHWGMMKVRSRARARARRLMVLGVTQTPSPCTKTILSAPFLSGDDPNAAAQVPLRRDHLHAP